MRKQIGISVALLLVVLSSSAQYYRELNRPNHDDWPYYFGMTLAYTHSYLHPNGRHNVFLQHDSVLTAEPGSSGGIALGLLGTLRLSNRFEARINPQLIIGGSRYFTYTLKYPDIDNQLLVVKQLPTTIVSFPFQLKFNSDRIDNFRVYMMAGVKMDIDLASNSNARNAEDLVKLKAGDYGVEVGIGFNFYMPFVTLSPEIKFSTGLGNIHSRDPNLKYSNIFDKLQTRMVCISLNLED
ncbi:MAG: protein-translocating porin PorT [Chitinophagaceae bacterium]|nr:protein-translocating porin PorT [Chitinophagaceae bacterium]